MDPVPSASSHQEERRPALPIGRTMSCGIAARSRSDAGLGAPSRRNSRDEVGPYTPPGMTRARLSGSSERSLPPGLKGGAALTLVWRCAIGARFALPRDADRRSAVPCLRTIRTVGVPARRRPPKRPSLRSHSPREPRSLPQTARPKTH